MSARSSIPEDRESGGTRRTRAERRAAEREAARHSRHKQRQGTPRWAILLGSLVVVVVGIYLSSMAFHSVQSQPGVSAASRPLTDAAAYDPSPSLLRVGSIAPDFTLRDADGFTYHLAAQRGHPVLLEFYAVWCPVCHREAPIMSHLMRSFMPHGVHIWSILSNPYGKDFETSNRTDLRLASRDDLNWYARTFNARYPQLIDRTYKVVNRYGIGAYPGLYVIDKTGRVVYAGSGFHDYKTLAKQVNQALQGKGA